VLAAVVPAIAQMGGGSGGELQQKLAAVKQSGVFQILWVYYGLLIASRPVIAWNVIAVFINFLNVGAYLHFVRKEKRQAQP
jgi:MtN3 and saliva related transmembrane protein